MKREEINQEKELKKMETNPTRILRAAALAFVALALFDPSAGAAVDRFTTGRATSVDRDNAFRAKEAATQISITGIPETFDPSKNRTLNFSCGAFATSMSVGEDGVVTFSSVKNVTGKWSIELLIIDKVAGTFKTVKWGSGSFRTSDLGRSNWNGTLVTDDFADGFPRRTSAFLLTEVRFTKNKKVNEVSSVCSVFISG